MRIANHAHASAHQRTPWSSSRGAQRRGDPETPPDGANAQGGAGLLRRCASRN